ncbi:hypothetical protein [Kitasatospora sp. NPDC056800]
MPMCAPVTYANEDAWDLLGDYVAWLAAGLAALPVSLTARL